MTEGELGLFNSAPEAVFYLVSNVDAVENLSTEKSEFLDDRPGVQASLDLSQLANANIFDELLKRAKLGSRWGKDLSKFYQEYLQNRVKQLDESALADEFEAQFQRYDADPYESAVLGDALTIGIDLKAQIQNGLEEWGQHQFTRDDCAAAVGFSAKSENIGAETTYGGIVFKSDVPLSEIKQQNSSFVRASRNLQQLLLIGLDVALIAPVGQPDEVETIEETFRGVASFTIESLEETEYEVDDKIAAAVDQWYDRLRYAVADNRVVEQVVRPASVTAHDLPDEQWAQHFRKAITVGLQRAYSEKSFNKIHFDELWDKRISSHDNYDQYRSRRKTFPEVKVTRKDDVESHEFYLHHKGPAAKPHICNVPIQGSDPEKELIEWIERFLDAERISTERWQELTDTFGRLEKPLNSSREFLVGTALLNRHRQRKGLSPLLPPINVQTRISRRTVDGGNYDSAWYDSHWSTILSDFKITKQAGVGAVERKRELQHSLSPEHDADMALYYKLECDIENAWEYYLRRIVEELKKSLTADQNVSFNQREIQSGHEIDVTIAPDSGQQQTVTIQILTPFSEVYVDENSVGAATVTNTVSEVIETLGTAVQIQNWDHEYEESIDLLYELTLAYFEVAEFEKGDLVYFDDIIDFCLSLQNVRTLFETSGRSVEAKMRELLGNDNYISRIRELDVTFHRKGSDKHGSVKVKGDKYIAMELNEVLE